MFRRSILDCNWASLPLFHLYWRNLIFIIQPGNIIWLELFSNNCLSLICGNVNYIRANKITRSVHCVWLRSAVHMTAFPPTHPSVHPPTHLPINPSTHPGMYFFLLLLFTSLSEVYKLSKYFFCFHYSVLAATFLSTP